MEHGACMLRQRMVVEGFIDSKPLKEFVLPGDLVFLLQSLRLGGSYVVTK